MSGRRQSLNCHGQPFSLKTMRKLTGRWAIWLKVWLLSVTILRLSDWLLAVTTLRLIGCWRSLPCVWLAAGCHYLVSDWLLAVTTLCLIGCWLAFSRDWSASFWCTKSWTRLFVDTKSVLSPGSRDASIVSMNLSPWMFSLWNIQEKSYIHLWGKKHIVKLDL